MTLGLHRHETWELLLQMEGSTSWTCDRRQIAVRTGELLVCPPHLPHGKSRREARDFRFYFLGCRMDPEVWEELRHHLPHDRITVLPNAWELARCFRAIEEELIFEQARQKEGVILAWKQLWLEIFRLAASPPRAEEREERWLAQRVHTLVEANPGARWTLHSISKLMGYSPSFSKRKAASPFTTT